MAFPFIRFYPIGPQPQPTQPIGWPQPQPTQPIGWTTPIRTIGPQPQPTQPPYLPPSPPPPPPVWTTPIRTISTIPAVDVSSILARYGIRVEKTVLTASSADRKKWVVVVEETFGIYVDATDLTKPVINFLTNPTDIANALKTVASTWATQPTPTPTPPPGPTPSPTTLLM